MPVVACTGELVEKFTSKVCPSLSVYCTFPVTLSIRAGIPKVRAIATKKISRDFSSATRAFHTPIGDIGIRCEFNSLLIWISFLHHSTNRIGSFINYPASSFEMTFLKKER